MRTKIRTVTQVLLIASGIYQIPFLSVPLAVFVIFKKILFGLYGGVLYFSRGSMIWLYWASPFAVWGLINVVSWLVYEESGPAIVYRLIQLLWIYGFTIFFAGEQARNLLETFPVKPFSLACLLLIAAVWHPEIRDSVLSGFGGNRFGFSIWLSQFVFIVFLVARRHEVNWFASALVWAAPIILLQVLSAGRTGLLASSLLVLYFSLESERRNYVLAVSYLLLIAVLGTLYGPAVGVDSAQSILRITPQLSDDYIFMNSEFLSFLDRFLSYRLSIIATAFSDFDFWDALIGKGVGNFHGFVLSEAAEVHNVYLRALGELGLFGLAALLLIFAQPFAVRGSSPEVRSSKVFMSIFLLVGASHSDFLLTGISTCMVFWICYAEVMRHKSELRE